MSTGITNNELKATGLLSKQGEIDGGAIHCYRTKREAERSWLMEPGYDYSCVIFKVEGIDQVGHNDKEIAFKKVKFVDTINDWEI